MGLAPAYPHAQMNDLETVTGGTIFDYAVFLSQSVLQNLIPTLTKFFNSLVGRDPKTTIEFDRAYTEHSVLRFRIQPILGMWFAV